MIWLTVISIILSIIKMMPTMLTMIQEIVEWIKGHPFHLDELHALVLKHEGLADPIQCKADFSLFHHKITGKKTYVP